MPVDVKNTLSHMKGQWINIDGREYQCDQEGVIRGIPEADAKQLLDRRNGPWRLFTERKPVSASVPEIVPPSLPPVPSVAPAPVPEPVAQSSEVPEATAVVEKIPGPGEEWPDPTTDMSIEYLQKMADAYQVKYSKNTSKKELVKRLAATMYE